MADNLKPYDPNKGFISFRLNPEAIKEELISFVPYNRTLRHIYNNPEGDIRETAKIAAYETPVLGSLLSGEYSDAAKEAILMGLPVRNRSGIAVDASSLRDAVNAHPSRKYYNFDNKVVAYKSGKKYIDAADNEPLPYLPNNRPKPYNNLNEVLKDINESEYLTNKYAPINDSYYDIKSKQEGLNSYNEFIRTNKVKPNEEVFYSDISSGNDGFYEINVLDKNTGKVKSYEYDVNKKKYKFSDVFNDVNDLVPGAKRKPVQQSEIDLMNKKLQEDIGLFNIEVDKYPDYTPIYRDAIYDWMYQQVEGE